jgi:hypothetical protein
VLGCCLPALRTLQPEVRSQWGKTITGTWIDETAHTVIDGIDTIVDGIAGIVATGEMGT